MKHIHAEIIKAMADNTSLSLFCRDTYDTSGEWWETSQWPTREEFEYFLCLSEYHAACVHWLNGGEVEYLANEMGEWISFGDRWSANARLFMTSGCEIRIKPEKKKLWIGVFPWTQLGYVVTDAYESRAELAYEISKTWGDREYQVIEREVG